MACSVCAANYGAWFTMSCGTRGIGAAGPHSPADVTVLSLLSWFPRRPAWAWPISQIAAGVQLRSDRLGNNVEKKATKSNMPSRVAESVPLIDLMIFGCQPLAAGLPRSIILAAGCLGTR